MEPRFKTETIHDLTLHREFQKSYNHSRTVLSLILLLGGLLLAYDIRYISLAPFISYYYLGLAVFLLILYFIRNSRKGGIQYKRMLLSNNGKPQHTIISMEEDGIVCADHDSANRYTYPYTYFRSIIASDNLLILVMAHRTCLILEKRWLKGGSVDELIAFLFEKCPNIKRKKLRKPTFGKWVNRFVAAVVIVGSIWALANLPGFSLWDRISGKLHNDMSYQEIAQKLEEVEIIVSEQAIAGIEEYDAQYFRDYGVEFYADNPYANKAYDLLYWEGGGIYDEETWQWTPSTSGIFWFDTEVFSIDTIYTDFFTGLTAMHPELNFTNIREDYSNADIEAGTGTVTVSFDYDGKHYSVDALYYYDWFDTDFLYAVGNILASDRQEKDLYFSFDGQAIFLYYGTSGQVHQLERLTDLVFYDTVHMLIGH